MLKKLLVSWVLLLGLFASNTQAQQFDWYETYAKTINLGGLPGYMAFGGKRTEIVWHKCGDPNASFVYGKGVYVVLCYELLDLPGSKMDRERLIQFYLAHELAHAAIYYYDIPITGSEEVAADELAATVLILLGKHDVIDYMVKFWGNNTDPMLDFDQHLHAWQRRFNIACLAMGENGNKILRCDDKWRRTLKTWTRLLGF